MSFHCENCDKSFKRKDILTRHIATACKGVSSKKDDMGADQKIETADQKIPADQKTIVLVENKANGKSVILNLVCKLHDLMRSRESITGQKAHFDIIRLLLLKFMETHVQPNGQLASMLDPANYECIPDFNNSYIKYLSFANIVTCEDLDFEDRIYYVWNMLSLNSITSAIFVKSKSFNCKPKLLQEACDKIYVALKDVDCSQLDEDVGGMIYEHFVNEKGGGGGQSLGQYFTPRKLINLIMKLNNKYFPDEKPASIYDPCAGTGGFLTEMYKLAKIPASEIYGNEIEPDTYASGLMNIMLASGSIGNLKNQNSFADNSIKKYDWIATNPPFGIKGVKYDDIKKNVMYHDAPRKKGQPVVKTCISAEEMYPVKSNDTTALFLQHCIAKLSFGGMCNIVLPNGKLITGKNEFEKTRKHLVEECELHAVLSVPSGVFDNAGVSTVVLFFGKHENTCTGDVDFYETNQSCTQLVELGTAYHTELTEKKYVLDWKYYKPKEEMKLLDSSWEIKTLGEVCEINFGTRITKKNTDKGEYPVYGGGDDTFSTNTYNREGITCKISRFALSQKNCVLILNKKYYLNDSGFTVKSAIPEMLDRYLWYYLILNMNNIYKLSEGAAQKNLNMGEFKKMQIPIPSLEKQREIINTCMKYDEKINYIKTLIEQTEKYPSVIKQLYIDPLFKADEVKTLGEVCDLMTTTKHCTNIGQKSGLYRFYNSSDNEEKKLYLDSFEIEQECVIIGNGGNVNINIDSKFTASKHVTVVKCKEMIYPKYLYYYLASNKNLLEDISKGATIKWINKENLSAIQIPIPNLEKQQEIIDKYRSLYSTVSNYKNSIEFIEKIKNDYLDSLFNISSDASTK